MLESVVSKAQGCVERIDHIPKARRLVRAVFLLLASLVVALVALLTQSFVLLAVAVVLLAVSCLLYPWHGGGKHAMPRKKAKELTAREPLLALTASVEDDDRTVEQAVFLDPHTTITTELPMPVMYRQPQEEV